MPYFSDELFSDAGDSLGFFVFYANGTIFSHHESSTQANNAVGSLNRDERVPQSVVGETHTTVDLYDADGNHVGSADFDEWGSFVPGTYKLGKSKNTSVSETSKPGR